MSRASSPSSRRRYGTARVCQLWEVPRSTVYARRARASPRSLRRSAVRKAQGRTPPSPSRSVVPNRRPAVTPGAASPSSVAAPAPARATPVATPTATVLPAAAPTASETPTPTLQSVRTSFGDGTYIVPDEVAPGIYVTSDAQVRCGVYDHRSQRVASGSGTITIIVPPDWSSIRVSNCGTFRPHTPTVRTSFGDGIYVVPDEVAPGIYVTSDAQVLCRVYDHRSQRVASGSGTITITVPPDWSSIRVSNCGTFRRQSAAP